MQIVYEHDQLLVEEAGILRFGENRFGHSR